MKGKAFILLSGIIIFFLNAQASEPGFKLSPALSWIDGGDLNRHIQGWQSYVIDRYLSPYSLECDLKELHRLWSLEAEITYDFSPRISFALGLESLTGEAQGSVSHRLSQEEDYFYSPQDFGTIFLDEQSFRMPRYRFQIIPLTITLYYFLPFGNRLDLYLGCGAGYYWGRVSYKESYQYDFDYKDEKNLSGSPVEFIDRYSSSGTYSEKTSSKAFGLHARAGLELKIRERFYLILEAQARKVCFSDWTGSKNDEYDWSHTWGYWGSFSDEGTEEVSEEGKLWMTDFLSEETGKSYSRVVFSAEKPVSAYSEARPAKINLNGLAIRVGIRIYF